MEMVRIFDTTLRDGEQAPGFSMNTAEKLRLARQLETLGVDVIEAGFPIASQGRFRGGARGGARRCATAPWRAWRARGARISRRRWVRWRPRRRPRVHVFLATSDLHLKYKLRISRAEALDAIGDDGGVRAVRAARRLSFRRRMPAAATSSFWREAFAIAADAGATMLNVPDTVGYTTPEEYGGDVPHAAGEAGRSAGTGVERALPQRSGTGGGEFAGGGGRLGRGRWNARSTASASARATRRWKRLPWRWRCGRDHYQAETRLKLSELCATSHCCRRLRACRCRRTRPWWARTRSRTRRASTRTES